jgi:hypothetical protein
VAWTRPPAIAALFGLGVVSLAVGLVVIKPMLATMLAELPTALQGGVIVGGGFAVVVLVALCVGLLARALRQRRSGSGRDGKQ